LVAVVRDSHLKEEDQLLILAVKKAQIKFQQLAEAAVKLALNKLQTLEDQVEAVFKELPETETLEVIHHQKVILVFLQTTQAAIMAVEVVVPEELHQIPLVDRQLQVIFQDHRLQKLVAEAELQEDLEEALQLETEMVDPAEEILDLAEAEETTVSQLVDQEVQELHY